MKRIIMAVIIVLSCILTACTVVKKDSPNQTDFSNTPVISASASSQNHVGGDIVFKDPSGNIVFDKTGISEAVAYFDYYAREYYIALTLTKQGESDFEKLTQALAGQYMSIYINGVLISAPGVNAPITGGSVLIKGDFTREQATEYCEQIK